MAGGVEQHVRRLDVAVHDAVRVRVVERGGDLGEDRGRGLRRERPPPEPVAERAAGHEPQRHPGPAVLDPVGVHRQDVRVLEPRRHARLLPEALGEGRVVQQLRGQDLQRDLALERRVVRANDDGHAAAAERSDDPVRSEARSGFEAHAGRG